MGCDIWSGAERRIGDKWEAVPDVQPFDWRSYDMFAFLAGVRNYSQIQPIATPRGLPLDCTFSQDDLGGEHSFSWLAVAELEAFDYDQEINDRRNDPDNGKVTTYREYLGQGFFEELAKVKAAGAERIVFGFDS